MGRADPPAKQLRILASGLGAPPPSGHRPGGTRPARGGTPGVGLLPGGRLRRPHPDAARLSTFRGVVLSAPAGACAGGTRAALALALARPALRPLRASVSLLTKADTSAGAQPHGDSALGPGSPWTLICVALAARFGSLSSANPRPGGSFAGPRGSLAGQHGACPPGQARPWGSRTASLHRAGPQGHSHPEEGPEEAVCVHRAAAEPRRTVPGLRLRRAGAAEAGPHVQVRPRAPGRRPPAPFPPGP